MNTFDPLTPAQIALLREVEAQPVVLKVGGSDNPSRWKDMQYLLVTGFVSNAVHHVSQNDSESTLIYKRTTKPQ